MPIPTGQSAKDFQERHGLRNTRRDPAPKMDACANKIHTFPLVPPLPLPGFLHRENGNPSPDRGLSDVWPHGVEGDEEKSATFDEFTI